MTSGWVSLLAFTFLCSVPIIEGNFRMAWLTSGDSNSGSKHWVTFQFIGKDPKNKTRKYYPNEYFHRGRVNRAYLDGSSVGDIDKVIVGVEKWGWNVHQDDWNGWVVLISDLETHKTYQIWPGWIDTDGSKVLQAREIPCKDKTSRPQNDCRVMGSSCGTAVSDDDAFAMAKSDYSMCLKACNMCVP